MKNLGQYFTTNENLQKKVISFIRNKPKLILEPSCGRGDLVKSILNVYPNIKFDCYEIDNSLDFYEDVKPIFGDFLKLQINKKYKTIIGNPPYISKKGKKNTYILFIEKCIKLLSNDGEFIFIIPMSFFTSTSTIKLVKEMLEYGSFTDIYYPNKENLFKGASIDIVVFRYQKGMISDSCNYNSENINIDRTQEYIFSSKEGISVKDYFDCYVGVVSGRDSIFKNKIGNVVLLTDEGKREKYIMVDSFPSGKENIDNYLLSNKEELLQRKIKRFDEKNWYQWGALRNIKKIENNKGKDCIYIRCLTRKMTNVAFIGKVELFSSKFLILIPKRELDLKYFIDKFNDEKFVNNHLYSGRFKINQRELINSYL